jgi:glycosyltransferase involved in cell wall biosynthesis
MPDISAVIITYNEERNIERCIRSVLPFSSEVIVVDSLSTDRTVEIAQSLNAKVFSQSFLGHIEQKNFASTKATHPFIFSIDADEEVSEELCKSILEAKNNWNADGYTMNRLTNYCGQWIHHSGWYPDKKLRLFDSRKGKWAGQNPHDKYCLNNDGTIKHLRGDLYHYSYYSVSEHIKQIDRFSTIAANAMFVSGKGSNVLKILLKPTIKFIRNYILKLGFLDGFYGFLICRITAFETFLKYSRLRELRKKGSN